MVMYARVSCPECGKMIAENWLVRHLKAEHPAPPPDYSDIDPECRPLVAAMNEFPGIRTISSCCGHERRPFLIGLVADSLDVLLPIVYLCSYQQHDWRVYAITDGGMSPITFALEGPVGAFADAETMAACMREYLAE